MTFISSLDKPASIMGVILSAYSMTETLAPKRQYTCPNSSPITPPPIITKCFGISLSFNASVEVITLSLSKEIKGRVPGLEPVAIILFLASMIWVSLPSIFMWVASI